METFLVIKIERRFGSTSYLTAITSTVSKQRINTKCKISKRSLDAVVPSKLEVPCIFHPTINLQTVFALPRGTKAGCLVIFDSDSRDNEDVPGDKIGLSGLKGKLHSTGTCGMPERMWSRSVLKYCDISCHGRQVTR